MFTLAILIGIYSYLILILGLLGLMQPNIIFSVTFFYIAAILFYNHKFLRRIRVPKVKFKKQNQLILILLFLISFVNLIGALGPETAFDALWYHLTLPKLYLLNNSYSFIPGNLLHYSAMPQLVEMIYVSALGLGNEISAKVIHFLFGVLTLIAIYKFTKKRSNSKFALIACLIFSSNLVVSWQSITAYVDLARTFFEFLAIWGLILWWETRERKWIVESAVMLGLSISVKVTGLLSIPVFLILIALRSKSFNEALRQMILFIAFSLAVPLPWFLLAFINTGNPLFPLLTENVPGLYFSFQAFNPLVIADNFWKILMRSADPISPIYLISIPLIIAYFKKMSKTAKLLIVYFIASFVCVYILPVQEKARFLLPYLPAFSIVIALLLPVMSKTYRNIIYASIIILALTTLFYRGAANLRYLPFILGQESKKEFLSKNLNFKFGDFYDTDGFFEKNLSESDTVLLYGFHNLYYLNFPFIHSSWVKPGDTFNFIAVKNEKIPDRFSFWNLIYNQTETGVKIYYFGGEKWTY